MEYIDYKEEYLKWVCFKLEDLDILEELGSIHSQEELIKDRFFKDLEFGTGGLRGIVGAGTNRVNIYTVRKTIQGFCNYLLKNFEGPSVAISYDSRDKSDMFAREAAKVLARHGVKVYLTDTLMPTPFLSYMVRKFGCSGGVMITASHNPYNYNGIKIYDHTGCQLTDSKANMVMDEIDKLDIFKNVRTCSFENAVKDGIIEVITENVYEEYERFIVSKDFLNGEIYDNLNILYTPLNGAGNKPVMNVLKRLGYKDVKIVKEQEYPDPAFTTCPYPNPEDKAALFMAFFTGGQEGSDIILATDPDGDRLGVSVRVEDGYRMLRGDEIGILLLDYIINRRMAKGTMPENPVVIKTIVSSLLVNKMCKENGIECVDVLTGFKYIGDQINKLERRNKEHNFIFGYEESYGYLADPFVRDKDAVLACMHVVRMASFYKSQGILLQNRLEEIYKIYGEAHSTQKSFDFLGFDGNGKMAQIMQNISEDYKNLFDGMNILYVRNYLTGEEKNFKDGTQTKISLPKSNVFELGFEDSSTLIVRPSGTEPKIKFYFSSYQGTKLENKRSVANLLKCVEKIISYK